MDPTQTVVVIRKVFLEFQDKPKHFGWMIILEKYALTAF